MKQDFYLMEERVHIWIFLWKKENAVFFFLNRGTIDKNMMVYIFFVIKTLFFSSHVCPCFRITKKNRKKEETNAKYSPPPFAWGSII